MCMDFRVGIRSRTVSGREKNRDFLSIEIEVYNITLYKDYYSIFSSADFGLSFEE